MGTDLVLFDKYLNVIGIIDEYRSLIWTERWGDLGDFELYMSPKQESVNMVMQAMYIARMDDICESEYKGWNPKQYPTSNNFRSVMVILERTINTSENGDEVVLKGKEALCLLQRRVVMGHYTSLDESIYEVMIDLWLLTWSGPGYTHFKPPAELTSEVMAARRFGRKTPVGSDVQQDVFGGFTIDAPDGYGDNMVPGIDSMGDNLYDIYITLEKLYGFKHESRIETAAYGLDSQRPMYDRVKIYVLPTADRSVNQLENPPVVISEKYDNLVSSSYTDTFTDYSSHAWVAGSLDAGYTSAWKGLVYGDDSYTGVLRSECYIDDTKEKLLDDEDRQKTWDELLSKYRTDARQKLKDLQRQNIADGEALNYNFIYDVDYFLGDIITFENKYGITFDARCTEVVHSIDDDGEVIYPSFTAV